jgi:hypothetical protein
MFRQLAADRLLHPCLIRSYTYANAGDKGAEQTRARNAIFKSPTHLIHFLNNYMLK